MYHGLIPILLEEIPMVICPVAIAVGCRKCPIFKVCPAKSIIGDQKPTDDEGKTKPTSKAKASRKSQ